MKAFNNNVTEDYAGGSDVSTWNLRAESSWVDTRAPRIGYTPFIPRPMTEAELSSYCESRNLDPANRLVKRNARTYIRKQQESQWRELVRNEKAEPVKPPQIPGKFHQRCLGISTEYPETLLTMTSETRQVLGTSSSKANVNIARKVLVPRKDLEDISIDPQLYMPEMASMIGESEPSISSNIANNTAHLNEEESENAVYLIELLTGTADISESLMAETPETEHADLLHSLEELEVEDSHLVHCSPKLFIDKFSAINVIRNDTAADMSEKKFEEHAATYVAIGNSRDAPSRLMFYCPNEAWGCDYGNAIHSRFVEHTGRCKISEENPVKPSIFKCRKNGCDERFRDVHVRNRHERDHDYQPRQCHLGCTDGKWYNKEQDWANHKRKKHDTEWDTSMLCQVSPTCGKTTGFPNRPAYQAHLSNVHKLKGEDAAKYFPEKKNKDPVWGKRSCPFPDCVRAAPGKEIGRKHEMVAHLTTKRGGHQCTPEEIEELIQQILSE